MSHDDISIFGLRELLVCAEAKFSGNWLESFGYKLDMRVKIYTKFFGSMCKVSSTHVSRKSFVLHLTPYCSGIYGL